MGQYRTLRFGLFTVCGLYLKLKSQVMLIGSEIDLIFSSERNVFEYI